MTSSAKGATQQNSIPASGNRHFSLLGKVSVSYHHHLSPFTGIDGEERKVGNGVEKWKSGRREGYGHGWDVFA